MVKTRYLANDKNKRKKEKSSIKKELFAMYLKMFCNVYFDRTMLKYIGNTMANLSFITA